MMPIVGFLTRNEKRQAAGYGPVPGGDDDEAKFNPYHDELGRFTFAPGGVDDEDTADTNNETSDSAAPSTPNFGNGNLFADCAFGFRAHCVFQ